MAKQSEAIQGTEKEFLDEFHKLCYSRSPWQVWADLMAAMACSLSNVADRSPEHYESREKEYAQCIERLGSVEVPAKMLAIIVEALERNPEQDFLGAMYMQLNLGNHWKGQFFTPYCVCKMMSEITCEDVDNHIEKQGYLSICDPTCGAGATLIAAANTMKQCKHNFQNYVVFVGQDIDRVTGMMCYIQLSLLGCAGYVSIANTLTNPLTGPVLFPNEKEGQELWYMPMFQNQIWTWRRLFRSMGGIGGTATTEKTVEKEHFYIFFGFKEQEDFIMSDNTKKNFTTGKEKLEYEENQILESANPKYRDVIKQQFDMVFNVLLKKVDDDSEFEKKILLNHKSFSRCMKYAAEKAMGMRQPSEQEKAAARNGTAPIVTPVSSDMLFQWIDEYYDLDDKEQVEKEQKAAKKKEAMSKSASKPKKQAGPNAKTKVEEKTSTAKKGQKALEGQIDIFSMLGM